MYFPITSVPSIQFKILSCWKEQNIANPILELGDWEKKKKKLKAWLHYRVNQEDLYLCLNNRTAEIFLPFSILHWVIWGAHHTNIPSPCG